MAEKKPAKKKPTRTGRAVNVWIPEALSDALQEFMDAQRVAPRLTDVVELALQEFLQREGHWPGKGE